jgi:hypothetical protein
MLVGILLSYGSAANGQMDYNSPQREEGKSVPIERGGDMRLKTTATMMLACAILLSVGGCASKIYQHPLLVSTPSETSAEVSFFREDGMAGAAVAVPVYVNDEKLLQLRRATYAKVFLKPGTYQVEVRRLNEQLGNPWITCGGPMELVAGKTYFVLLSFVAGESGMCFRPNLITEEGARSLMTTYTVVGQ